MIAHIKGQLVAQRPPLLVIDVQGIGYEVETPLTTFQTLPPMGEEVTLLTHFAVRDDTHVLYGFVHSTERELFRALIKISGIGPRLALLILSGMPPEQFAHCIRDNQTAKLIHLPGIGKKTAERLVIELRDRIDAIVGNAQIISTTLIPLANPTEDAISALVALGYTLPEATRRVRSLPVEGQGLSCEALIRLALQPH